MTHGFSSTDKGKKPMNMFYDFSTGKTYAYDDNEELQEVTIGGGSNMLLDYTNAVQILNSTSASGDTYTTPSDGAILGTWGGSGTNVELHIGNINYGSAGNTHQKLNEFNIPKGTIATVLSRNYGRTWFVPYIEN